MTRPATRRLPVAAALAAALLAGCSDDGPNAPSDEAALDQQAAEELALAVSDDAEAMALASTVSPALHLDGLGRPGPHFRHAFRLPAACAPALSPETPANADGDAVPDALLADFTGVSCGTDAVTLTLAGTLGIEDPAIPGAGVRFVVSDLSQVLTRVATGESVARTWDGVRQVVGSPSQPGSQLTHTITGFLTTWTLPAGRGGSHLKNWNATFDADVPGTIAWGERLPSGTWSFDGNSTWTRNAGGSWAVDAMTTSPLHFEASCDLAPRFDAGEVRLEATRNGRTTVVTVAFPACGQVVVTRPAS